MLEEDFANRKPAWKKFQDNIKDNFNKVELTGWVYVYLPFSLSEPLSETRS